MVYVAFISAVILALLFAAELLGTFGLMKLMNTMKYEPAKETAMAGMLGMMVAPMALFIHWIASTFLLRSRNATAHEFAAAGLIAVAVTSVLLFATGTPVVGIAFSAVFIAPVMLLHYCVCKRVFSEYFFGKNVQKKSVGLALNGTWEK